MWSRIMLRLAFSSFVAAGLGALVLIARSQSQDSESVVEAARRAREKKKDAPKSTKVFTNDTLDVKKDDVQSAVAVEPKMPGAPEVKAPSASAPSDGSADSSNSDERRKKEVAALKEQIKQAQSDVDLLQRERALQQDTYYSNPDFAHDTAGKAKLDDAKKQISDKQQEVDKLKARLAALDANADKPAPNTSEP